jgi:hypothetical protein
MRAIKSPDRQRLEPRLVVSPWSCEERAEAKLEYAGSKLCGKCTDTSQLFPKKNREAVQLFIQPKAFAGPCVNTVEGRASVRARKCDITESSRLTIARNHYERRSPRLIKNSR